MQLSRVNVPLEVTELEALVRLAKEQCRQPREQARMLIRDQLRQLGQLPQLIAADSKEIELPVETACPTDQPASASATAKEAETRAG